MSTSDYDYVCSCFSLRLGWAAKHFCSRREYSLLYENTLCTTTTTTTTNNNNKNNIAITTTANNNITA